MEFIVIGLIAGWLMGKIRGGKGFGFFGNLLVGVIGSLIGWFLMGFLGIQSTGFFIRIVMALCGAIIFFLVVGLFRGSGKKRSSKGDDE